MICANAREVSLMLNALGYARELKRIAFHYCNYSIMHAKRAIHAEQFMNEVPFIQNVGFAMHSN